jgi:pterin-4a-carbinolamine dehydratase
MSTIDPNPVIPELQRQFPLPPKAAVQLSGSRIGHANGWSWVEYGLAAFGQNTDYRCFEASNAAVTGTNNRALMVTHHPDCRASADIVSGHRSTVSIAAS